MLLTAFGLTLADFVLSGVSLDSWVTLAVAALLLGFVNAFVRPLVIFLTFPLTLFSLGLFLLVINGTMVMLVAWLVPSFHLDGLGWGVLAAIIIGLTGWIANAFVGPTGRVEVWTIKSEK